VARVASAFGGRRREPFAAAGRYGAAVPSPPRDLRLTYCGNVHAAPDLDTWLHGLHENAAPVAAHARARGRAFGIGSWWPADLAALLSTDAAAFARVRGELDRLQLPLWTMNVFPHGGFHDAVVKTAVYAPDWAHEDRLQYTRACAEVAARLAPPGAVVPLSTLPLGWRPPGASADLRLMARNLARAASAFAALEDRTGVRCVLALEPEPDCLLETCAQAAEFLDRWLFDEGGWTTVPAPLLRRHLGVCIDLCHLFVVGEDPVAALELLRRRGIAVPKVQVSSCLELRDGSRLDELLAFDEPRYLHQTAAEGGARALDLGDVRRRRAEFARAPRIRTHCHMPIYWDQPGALGSTRAQLDHTLAAWRDLPEPPLFEVETYTWSVLPAALRDRPLPELLARELDHAANLLGV